MTAKNAPPLAANTGRIRTPTTLPSVRPGPGNWVCFWYQTSPTCTAISASRMPGKQQHVDDVEPRDDLGAGELAAEQRQWVQVPITGIDSVMPEAIRSPVPESRSSGSE